MEKSRYCKKRECQSGGRGGCNKMGCPCDCHRGRTARDHPAKVAGRLIKKLGEKK